MRERERERERETGGFRGGGRDVRPPKKTPNSLINTNKINGEERKQRERERREVQSLRLKLS